MTLRICLKSVAQINSLLPCFLPSLKDSKGLYLISAEGGGDRQRAFLRFGDLSYLASGEHGVLWLVEIGQQHISKALPLNKAYPVIQFKQKQVW